jgi:hypothetical protein
MTLIPYLEHFQSSCYCKYLYAYCMQLLDTMQSYYWYPFTFLCFPTVRFQRDLLLNFCLYLFSHSFEVHVQLLITLVPCYRLVMVSWILDIKFFLFIYIKFYNCILPSQTFQIHTFISFHFLPYWTYTFTYCWAILSISMVFFFIFHFSNLLRYLQAALLNLPSTLRAINNAMLFQTMDRWSNQFVRVEHRVYSKLCCVWRHDSSRDVGTVKISPHNIHTVQNALEII